MHVTFAPRGIVQIDEARICYCNFAGEASQYNRKGDRNFAVVIDDKEIADALTEDGWNVRVKPPRDVDDDPFMYLPVKVKFNGRGPIVYIQSGEAMHKLDEDDVDTIDDMAKDGAILSVDMDLRPYDWEVNGKTGRTAYLQSIHVTKKVDRFAARFARNNDDAVPF